MDLNLGKRRSGGGGMSSSADRMASEVARAASGGGTAASGAGGQQSYELIKSTQVGTNTGLEIAPVGLLPTEPAGAISRLAHLYVSSYSLDLQLYSC